MEASLRPTPAPARQRRSATAGARAGLVALALGIFALARAEPPVIDNERVTVRDTTGAVPAVPLDFVAVRLDRPGTAEVGRKGSAAGAPGAHTVVIELKDHPVAPIPNTSGYPPAFPRPHVERLFESDRVIVWSYRWLPGEPTPMHFHDKDVVVVFEEDTVLRSTTPDGRSVVNTYKSGDIRFNRRDRTHTERLVGDSGSAVITELK
jgi:hypothetical protein